MRRGQTEEPWTDSPRCRECGIRGMTLFADLTEADFALIHPPIVEIRRAAGEILYSAGDDGEALYTVRSGLLKLVLYLPDGAQRIVRLLKRGDSAGLEVSLGQPYEHTAIALRPTSVCRIPRPVIARLRRETPRLHDPLMARWHAALTQADAWLSGLSTGKATQRLARLLVWLAEPDGTAELFPREDLGAMLGITTEHASRTVAELKRQDALFEVSANHYRCDLDLLACIAAQDC